MEITILTESELRESVSLDQETLTAVEDGFTRLANDQAMMPPIMRVDIPENNGEVDIKTAYLKGLDSFAVKMSSGFFDNYKLGLPSLGGMMILLSTKVGFPQALLLDNGYLTDVRTGAAGAIAAKYLAREQIDTVGVVGAGGQARYQIRALQQVRDFKRLLIHNRTPARIEPYIEAMTPDLGVEIIKAENLQQLVQESDLVVTTTPAKRPYLKTEWLHPGLHITAIGSDAEEKQELEAGVLGQADLLVCDRTSQAFRLGELHHALEAGVISDDEERIVELGEITAGRRPGRQSDEQITVADLTGTGVQDTAIALLAYRKALEAGLGLKIET